MGMYDDIKFEMDCPKCKTKFAEQKEEVKKDE